MARLSIGGTEYPVSEAGVRYDDLTKRRETFGGKIATARPAAATARVWVIQTDILTRTEANTLLAALTAPGTVSADGEAVGGSAVTCRAANIRAEEVFDDIVFVSFELWEVAP